MARATRCCLGARVVWYFGLMVQMVPATWNAHHSMEWRADFISLAMVWYVGMLVMWRALHNDRLLIRVCINGSHKRAAFTNTSPFLFSALAINHAHVPAHLLVWLS